MTEIILCPELIKLGTFLASTKNIVLNYTGLLLNNLESCQTSSSYPYVKAFIPFTDMTDIRHSRIEITCGPNQVINGNALIVKTTEECNQKIKTAIGLDEDSAEGHKFNVNSSVFWDKYILIISRTHINSQLMASLNRWIRTTNPKIRLIEFKFSEHFFIPKVNIQIKSVPNQNKNRKQEIEFHYNPIDVMFGTFECNATKLILSLDSITIIDFKAKDQRETKPHISIPWAKLDSLAFNVNQSIITIFGQLGDTCTANHIKSQLNDENNSLKYKFDINSEDKRENYIIFRLEDEIPEVLALFLKKMSTFDGIVFQVNQLSDQKTIDMIESTRTLIELIKDSMKVKEMKTQMNEMSEENKSLKRKFKELEQKTENDIFCGICLEKRSVIMTRMRKIVSTLCGHVFCKDCLDSALKVRDKCPICAQDLFTTNKYIEIHI